MRGERGLLETTLGWRAEWHMEASGERFTPVTPLAGENSLAQSHTAPGSHPALPLPCPVPSGPFSSPSHQFPHQNLRDGNHTTLAGCAKEQHTEGVAEMATVTMRDADTDEGSSPRSDGRSMAWLTVLCLQKIPTCSLASPVESPDPPHTH